MKTKNEFIRALNYELRLLNQSERDELISFYEDRFANAHYEGKSEVDVIQELEAPAQIAKNIYDEYGIDPSNLAKPRQNTSLFGSVVLVILIDLFVATWATPTLFGLTFGLGGSLFTFPLIFTGMSEYGIFANLLNIAFGVAGYFLLFLFVVFLADLSIRFTAWLVSLHIKLFDFELSEKVRRFPNEFSVKKFLKLKNWNLKLLVPLCIIALIFSPIAHLSGGFKDINFAKRTNISDELIEETHTFTYSKGTELYFDIVSANITYKVGDVNKIKVDLAYYEKDQFIIKQDGNTVKLTRRNDHFNISVFNLFSFDKVLHNSEVVVTIPREGILGDVTFDTVSGNIYMDDFIGLDLDLDTVSGNIVLTNIQADEIDTNTVSGRVTATEVDTNNLKVETVSGDIYLDSLGKVPEGIDIDSVSGDSIIKNVLDTNIEIDTVSGDATYHTANETTRSHVDFDSVSGDFNLK